MLHKEDQDTHLFLVRCWSEEVAEKGMGDSHREWRGRVQHVLSGEAHTFQDWPSLIDLLLEMVDTEEIEEVEAKAREGQKKESIK